MDILSVRTEYEAKKRRIAKEIDCFLEKATNYEELIESYGEKSLIHYEALEFNTTEETRYFDNLQSTAWMIRQVLVLCAVYGGMNDEERKSHMTKKALNTLMGLIRNVKKISNMVIEREQRVINEADLVLNLVSHCRNEIEEGAVTE